MLLEAGRLERNVVSTGIRCCWFRRREIRFFVQLVDGVVGSFEQTCHRQQIVIAETDARIIPVVSDFERTLQRSRKERTIVRLLSLDRRFQVAVTLAAGRPFRVLSCSLCNNCGIDC